MDFGAVSRSPLFERGLPPAQRWRGGRAAKSIQQQNPSSIAKFTPVTANSRRPLLLGCFPTSGKSRAPAMAKHPVIPPEAYRLSRIVMYRLNS